MNDILKPFRVKFNNRKKPKEGPQSFDCDAGVFLASGHVVIDIDASKIQPLYASVDEMMDTLKWWGDVQVEGLEESDGR